MVGIMTCLFIVQSEKGLWLFSVQMVSRLEQSKSAGGAIEPLTSSPCFPSYASCEPRGSRLTELVSDQRPLVTSSSTSIVAGHFPAAVCPLRGA